MEDRTLGAGQSELLIEERTQSAVHTLHGGQNTGCRTVRTLAAGQNAGCMIEHSVQDNQDIWVQESQDNGCRTGRTLGG